MATGRLRGARLPAAALACALVAAPEAAGRLTRSALNNALTGWRLPSEQLLEGFAAA